MDDWVLSEFNIPSVTNELGTEDQYTDSWQVKDRETALTILEDNSHWLDHLYEKLGVQLTI